MQKRKVDIKRSCQSGKTVYQLAKLRMLQFCYQFVERYIDREKIVLVKMRTDSAHMALVGKSIDVRIKKGTEEEKHRKGKTISSNQLL